MSTLSLRLFFLCFLPLKAAHIGVARRKSRRRAATCKASLLSRWNATWGSYLLLNWVIDLLNLLSITAGIAPFNLSALTWIPCFSPEQLLSTTLEFKWRDMEAVLGRLASHFLRKLCFLGNYHTWQAAFDSRSSEMHASRKSCLRLKWTGGLRSHLVFQERLLCRHIVITIKAGSGSTVPSGWIDPNRVQENYNVRFPIETGVPGSDRWRVYDRSSWYFEIPY